MPILYKFNLNKKTPWPESAKELYRPSDRRLSAKLVPTALLFKRLKNSSFRMTFEVGFIVFGQ
jgi:hypothetical protein